MFLEEKDNGVGIVRIKSGLKGIMEMKVLDNGVKEGKNDCRKEKKKMC